MEGDEEDQIALTDPSFKLWKNSLLAQTNNIRMILKIADFLDSSKADKSVEEGDDAEFEDCELEDDDEEDENVIDMDEFKESCIEAVFGWLEQIMLRTQPIPQLIGLARHAEDALDELQEISFAILTSLLFSDLPAVKQRLELFDLTILQLIVQFIELATYKCERPSGENASECLAALVENSNQARQAIFQGPILNKVLSFGIYMRGKDSMAKLYIIQVVQKVLSTSSAEATSEILVCEDMTIIQKVTELLIESCQLADLVLISASLDAFYDVFSEDYYNQVLIDNNIIEQMQQSHQGLVYLFQQNKAGKLLDKSELANAENALENLPLFVEYKKKEMNLQ